MGQGLTLTVVGMCIVFAFLGILVLLMKAMSKVIKGIDARREAKAERAPEPVDGEYQPEEAEDLSEVAAALALYVHSGGRPPSAGGEGKEDIAAAFAAVAAAGGPRPQGKSHEVAAALAAVTFYKNT